MKTFRETHPEVIGSLKEDAQASQLSLTRYDLLFTSLLSVIIYNIHDIKLQYYIVLARYTYLLFLFIPGGYQR